MCTRFCLAPGASGHDGHCHVTVVVEPGAWVCHSTWEHSQAEGRGGVHLSPPSSSSVFLLFTSLLSPLMLISSPPSPLPLLPLLFSFSPPLPTFLSLHKCGFLNPGHSLPWPSSSLLGWGASAGGTRPTLHPTPVHPWEHRFSRQATGHCSLGALSFQNCILGPPETSSRLGSAREGVTQPHSCSLERGFLSPPPHFRPFPAALAVPLLPPHFTPSST